MWQGTVNTASGGFQAVPSYAARIVGSRQFQSVPVGAPADEPQTYVVDALVSTPSGPSSSPPTAQQFTVQIFPVVAGVLTSSPPDPNDLQNVITKWQVAWIGIEG
jgi:hypothetical protein